MEFIESWPLVVAKISWQFAQVSSILFGADEFRFTFLEPQFRFVTLARIRAHEPPEFDVYHFHIILDIMSHDIVCCLCMIHKCCPEGFPWRTVFHILILDSVNRWGSFRNMDSRIESFSEYEVMVMPHESVVNNASDFNNMRFVVQVSSCWESCGFCVEKKDFYHMRIFENISCITLTVTAFPRHLYLCVSLTMLVQLSGKPWSLSHSIGVNLLILIHSSVYCCICVSSVCATHRPTLPLLVCEFGLERFIESPPPA